METKYKISKRNTKTQKKEIENAMKAAKNHEDFNLQIPGGFIYCTGGILCKLIDTKQFIAINGRWIECMN